MLVPYKCPNCGANVQVEDDAVRVTCSYCGAVSTARPPVAAPLPEPTPQRDPSPRAPAPRPSPASEERTDPGSLRWGLVASVLPLGIPLCGGLFALVDAVRTAGVGEHFWESLRWSPGDAPIVADVDGDGDDDVIGILYETSNDGTVYALGALDPEEDARLWMLEDIVSEVGYTRLALFGKRLWLADQAGTLRAYDPANGALLQERSLGERADAFCSDGEEGLLVLLADRSLVRVDVQTATLTPVGRVDHSYRCRGGFPVSRAGGSVETRWLWHARLDLDIEGRRFHDGLEWDGHGVLLAAERAEGTRVPMVIAVREASPTRRPSTPRSDDPLLPEPDPAEKAWEVAWQAEIPSGDPLQTGEGSPRTLGAGGGRVFAPWELREGENPSRLSAFDGATGTRLWDAVLPGSYRDVRAVVADEARVYVTAGANVLVLDAATGEIRRWIGRRDE
jgi:PQQ-like domain